MKINKYVVGLAMLCLIIIFTYSIYLSDSLKPDEEIRDDINLLVFVDAQTIVKFAEIPRSFGDFIVPRGGVTIINREIIYLF